MSQLSRVTTVTCHVSQHLVVTLEPRHVVGPEGGALQRGHVLGVALEGHLRLGRLFVELQMKARNYLCLLHTLLVELSPTFRESLQNIL